MSAATPLFDRYAVDDITSSRHKGSETSEAAHRQTRETHADLRRRILAYIESRGSYGATWAEASDALSISYQNSGRVTQLVAAGLIVPSGCVRETPSGCGARVLVAKEFAP
jgi:hypothetical protein